MIPEITKMGKPAWTVTIILLFLNLGLKAQVLEVGAGIGGSGYVGDLNVNRLLKISGISAGGYVKMNFDAHWSLSANYTYGKIRANDLKSDEPEFRQRGLNFTTALNEASLQVDFNFFDYFAGGGRRKFTPYLFVGAGGILFNPKANYSKYDLYDVVLRHYRTEGQNVVYRNYAFTVPYGAGLKFQLKENWGLFTQIGYRTAFTDYIDDVSKTYPGENYWEVAGFKPERINEAKSLSNPSLQNFESLQYTQRGDFRKRDTYMFVGIGISYTFVSQKCYTF